MSPQFLMTSSADRPACIEEDTTVSLRTETPLGRQRRLAERPISCPADPVTLQNPEPQPLEKCLPVSRPLLERLNRWAL